MPSEHSTSGARYSIAIGPSKHTAIVRDTHDLFLKAYESSAALPIEKWHVDIEDPKKTVLFYFSS